jgi:2-succinyl-6-hydroxy-2,4-cyclohexadiene-1-carboxylate synthase
MGYSLGGRIALHAAIADPTLWFGIVVIAGHPGIPDSEDRGRRIEADRGWSTRFLKEPWNRVMADWNNQAIFQGHTSPWTPAGEPLDPQSIAHWFERCSTGSQKNLRPLLAASDAVPILYLTGEDAQKYTGLGRSLASACPCVTHSIIPGAAHRVPWEAPEAFIATAQAFFAAHG